MASQTLEELKVAILVTDGFEEPELTEPVQALKNAGALVTIVSPSSGEFQGAMQSSSRAVPSTRTDCGWHRRCKRSYGRCKVPASLSPQSAMLPGSWFRPA